MLCIWMTMLRSRVCCRGCKREQGSHLPGERTMLPNRQGLHGKKPAASARCVPASRLWPTQAAPRRGLGRRGSGCGEAVRRVARQTGLAARLEPKGLDYCPPRGENAADGPVSRATSAARSATRARAGNPNLTFANSTSKFQMLVTLGVPPAQEGSATPSGRCDKRYAREKTGCPYPRILGKHLLLSRHLLYYVVRLLVALETGWPVAWRRWKSRPTQIFRRSG